MLGLFRVEGQWVDQSWFPKGVLSKLTSASVRQRVLVAESGEENKTKQNKRRAFETDHLIKQGGMYRGGVWGRGKEAFKACDLRGRHRLEHLEEGIQRKKGQYRYTVIRELAS